MMPGDDTIVAAATPPGVGGIGVVRLSGPDAEAIAARMLGSLPEPRVAAYRRFLDVQGKPIDAGIVLYFPAPASFTGESVVELQGHGGPVVLAGIVETAVTLGARRAEPGEFARRAFLNDKIDLAQAEAIVDLVQSGTAQAARAAMQSLAGRFSDDVEALAAELLRLRMYVEAAIDFPEEEIDFLADDQLAQGLERWADAYAELAARTRAGRVLRDGYRVVIVGKPNAGKSSLMNRLSGEDTAIVTEFAGTTRDVLRERIDVDGLAVELVDTAGLRDNPEVVEAEGIRRARRAMMQADAVLWIHDATRPTPGEPDEGIPPEVPISIIRNKTDLTGESPGRQDGNPPVICLSAKTGAGVAALREHIRELAGHEDRGEGAYTARRRHVEALGRAWGHFAAGRDALHARRAGELLAEELRLAHDALGEITGTVTPDDLLGKIFSEFCIGK